MKKLLTYLIGIFAVLSCGEKGVLPNEEPAAISFAVPEVAETKSVLITDKTQLISGENQLAYSVFAARYIPSDPANTHQKFMDDVKVFSIDGGTTWSYPDANATISGDQKYYWSPGAIHKFFAVYPYYDKTNDIYDLGISYAINEEKHALQVTGKHTNSETDQSSNTVTRTLICTGVDEDGINLCPDILYGVTMYSQPYNIGEDREPISFNLNHALTAVSFNLRNASEYVIESISATEIKGFMNASEYVLLSEDGAVWAQPESVDNHKFIVPGISTTIGVGEYYPSTRDQYWYTALMIPQNFGVYQKSPTFTFTVTFKDNQLESKSYTINFKDYAVNDVAEHGYTFLPGYHYVYNLNVTARGIHCDVEVVPWIEDEIIKLN